MSFINGLVFIFAFVVAFITRDTNSIGILTGAVVSSSSTVVSFWLGGAFRLGRHDSDSGDVTTNSVSSRDAGGNIGTRTTTVVER